MDAEGEKTEALGAAFAWLPNGSVFAEKYEIRAPMRSGGMGALFEVIDRRTGRKRALKVLLPTLSNDVDMVRRFRDEVLATSHIASEHVVEVVDAGVDPDTTMPFLVMELLEGEDLASYLSNHGRGSFDLLCEILRQISLALERTHAAGLVHRDLKPSNLFLSVRDDGSPWLKVLDFGIAKTVSDSTSPATTRAVGTPLYMAPEQVHGDGDIDGRADLYSLAHVAYEFLVGEAYFSLEHQRSTYAVLLAVAQGVTEPPRHRARRSNVTLPLGFDAWFLKATAVDPAARFASAREFFEAFSKCQLEAPPPGEAVWPPVALVNPPPRAVSLDKKVSVGNVVMATLLALTIFAGGWGGARRFAPSQASPVGSSPMVSASSALSTVLSASPSGENVSNSQPAAPTGESSWSAMSVGTTAVLDATGGTLSAPLSTSALSSHPAKRVVPPSLPEKAAARSHGTSPSPSSDPTDIR